MYTHGINNQKSVALVKFIFFHMRTFNDVKNQINTRFEETYQKRIFLNRIACKEGEKINTYGCNEHNIKTI